MSAGPTESFFFCPKTWRIWSSFEKQKSFETWNNQIFYKIAKSLKKDVKKIKYFQLFRSCGYVAILRLVFCSCAKKLRFFGFAVHFGLRILRSLAFGCRFSSKKTNGFFGIFSTQPWKWLHGVFGRKNSQVLTTIDMIRSEIRSEIRSGPIQILSTPMCGVDDEDEKAPEIKFNREASQMAEKLLNYARYLKGMRIYCT